MSRRIPQLLLAMVALFGIVAITIVARSGGSGDDRDATAWPSADGAAPASVPDLPPEEEALLAARDFLDRYVDPDGRVRREPEGDTVSEGQAYAMLLAVAVDDAQTFGSVWAWTSANLLGPGGTLAWRWRDGSVLDPNAATDADLDAARALVLAADRFGVPEYRDAGVALATALAREDTVMTSAGPVLVAGPWASTSPHYVNPSYFSPVAFEQLAAATGDDSWAALSSTSHDLLVDLTAGGTALPPDWAVVDSGGSASPAPPAGGGAVSFGYGLRTLPRLAEACSTPDRQLAAALGVPVASTVDTDAGVANLDGSPQQPGDNPLFLLAGAAAARADGDVDRAEALLDDASAASAAAPSYYLGAWVALTRVLLDTDLLGGCGPTGTRG